MIKSLRARITMAIAALQLALLALFGSFVYGRSFQQITSDIDRLLVTSAKQAVASFDVMDGTIRLYDPADPPTERRLDVAEHGLVFRILDPNGNVLHESKHEMSASFGKHVPKDNLFEEIGAFRVLSYPIESDGKVVGSAQAAMSLEARNSFLANLLVGLIGGGLAMAALGIGAAYLIAARALAPIDRITATASAISTSDLSKRIGLSNSGDEVGRLAATFDGMLTRLQGGFERERQFTSDAAHELRTPLAAFEAILSSVEQTGPGQATALASALPDLRHESTRLSGLVEKLLCLARTDGGADLEIDNVCLGEVIDDTCHSLAPLFSEVGVMLSTELDMDASVRGDRDQLIRLFFNVLDNARLHARATFVCVRMVELPDTCEVRIKDDGIGISQEHSERIFDRFYRVDPSRSSPGSGLGLALAKQIVERHQGSIEVRSILDEGTEFVIRLPKLSNKS